MKKEKVDERGQSSGNASNLPKREDNRKENSDSNNPGSKRDQQQSDKDSDEKRRGSADSGDGRTTGTKGKTDSHVANQGKEEDENEEVGRNRDKRDTK